MQARPLLSDEHYGELACAGARPGEIGRGQMPQVDSRYARAVSRGRASRRLAIGIAWVGVLFLIGMIGPVFTADPIALDIDRGLTELGAPLAPSSDFILGSDHL